MEANMRNIIPLHKPTWRFTDPVRPGVFHYEMFIGTRGVAVLTQGADEPDGEPYWMSETHPDFDADGWDNVDLRPVRG
jgi:hypothetical protein